MELRVVAAITASKKTGVLFCWVCIFDFVVVAAAQTRFLFFFFSFLLSVTILFLLGDLKWIIGRVNLIGLKVRA